MASKCPQPAEKASIWEEKNFSISTPKPWVTGSNPPAPAKQKGLSQMHYKMRERQLSHSCLHRDRHSKQKKPLLEANIKDDKRAGPKTRFFRSYFV